MGELLPFIAVFLHLELILSCHPKHRGEPGNAD